MSQNSYLREFCAQVSHVVFLVDLTVLQLITTVWTTVTKLHTNRVLSILHRSKAFYNYEKKMSKSYLSSVHKTHIS